MRDKIILFTVSFLLVMSLIGNVLLFWGLKSSQSVIESQLLIMDLMESFVKSPPSDLSKDEVLHRLENLFPYSDIEAGENFILVDGAKFYFKEDMYLGSSLHSE